MPELSMDDRYGRRPPRYKGLAITLLIIGGSWLAWAGLHHSNPEIRTNLISFSVVSDRSISLRYSIDRRTSSDPITCTLVAHDFDKNVIGEINDVFTPGATHAEKTTLIATRNTPVNAAISRCWVSTQ
ncbi:MAG: DUF4307 domain-containing protein [Actinomycetes bacterium]